MKNTLKYLLQRGLGFGTYLYTFALFKINTLRKDKKEKDFFHFIHLLKDGKGDVLDIGANLGIMTFHLCKNFPNSTIHAFEPMPDNLKVLRKIQKRFRLTNATIHPVALGDYAGEVTMVLPEEGNAKQQGLSHVLHESITEWNEGSTFKVPIHPLDEVLNGQVVQGIKMDVENFEYFVLRGAHRILKQHHPVIYTELWDNENRKHCFALLDELSYSAFVVDGGKLVPYATGKHCTQNFIFIPAEKIPSILSVAKS